MPIKFDDEAAPVPRSRIKFDEPALNGGIPDNPGSAIHAGDVTQNAPSPEPTLLDHVGSALQEAGHLGSAAIVSPLGLIDKYVGVNKTLGPLGKPAIDAPTSGVGADVQGALDSVGSGIHKLDEKVPGAEKLLSGAADAATLLGIGGAVKGAVGNSAARSAIKDSTKIMGARTPEELRDLAGFKVSPAHLEDAGDATTIKGKAGQYIAGGDLNRANVLNNLDRTEDIVRQELNVPAGTKITDKHIADYEAQHKDAYNKVDALPAVNFTPDLRTSLGKAGLSDSLLEQPAAVTQLRNEMLGLTGGTGKQIRTTIGDLRAKARDNLATADGVQLTPRDRDLGNAQADMAHALEDELGRQLPPEDLAAYTDARRGFAISNAIRRARVGDRIDPRVIGKEGEINKGMDGGLRLIADMATRYPKDFTASVPQPSGNALGGVLARGGAATVGGVIGGLPGAAAGLAASEAVPAIVRRNMSKGTTGDIAAGAPDLFKRRNQAPKEVAPAPADPDAELIAQLGPQAPLIDEALAGGPTNKIASPPLTKNPTGAGAPQWQEAPPAADMEQKLFQSDFLADRGPFDPAIEPAAPSAAIPSPTPNIPADSIAQLLDQLHAQPAPAKGYNQGTPLPEGNYGGAPLTLADDTVPPGGGELDLPARVPGQVQPGVATAPGLDARFADHLTWDNPMSIVPDGEPLSVPSNESGVALPSFMRNETPPMNVPSAVQPDGMLPQSRKLYRGVPEGADPLAFNDFGARFLTPDESVASTYGKATPHDVNLEGFHEAQGLDELRTLAGVPADADVPTIIKGLIANTQLKGVSYPLPPGIMDDVPPVEYAQFNRGVPNKGPPQMPWE